MWPVRLASFNGKHLTSQLYFALYFVLEFTRNKTCHRTEAAAVTYSGELLTNMSTNVGAAKSESQYERDQSSFVELMFVAAAAAVAAAPAAATY